MLRIGVSRRFPLHGLIVFVVAGVGACFSARPPSPSTGADGATPAAGASSAAGAPVPAPAGFDSQTNGFETQKKFDKDLDGFAEIEHVCANTAKKIKGGLGPVYNDTACGNCHQNPVTGSSGQTAEIRAGFKVRVQQGARTRFEFVEPVGGSLIHQRATDARIQEHVPASDPNAPDGVPVRALRLTTNILGDGFVEVLPDEDILGYQDQQPHKMKGLAIPVHAAVAPKGPDGKPVIVQRIGRFGWKCQEASLLNFSSGAYLNEMGITSLLNATEDQSNGRDVAHPLAWDPVAEPEDDTAAPHPYGEDVEGFTRFMRATKAPPQAVPDGVTADDVRKGEAIFGTDRDNAGVFGTEKGHAGIGCAACHRPAYTTPAEGALIHVLNQPTEPASDLPGSKVPAALASKVIRPYSDFMLHNIGTGDGIVQTQHAQNPPSGSKNMKRIMDPAAGGAAATGPATAAAKIDLGKYNIADIERQKGGAERTLRRNGQDVEPPGRRLVEKEAAGGGDADAPQELDQRTARMVRTAPLWGLRVRPQLLHDGTALTVDEAIRRHKGQADKVEEAYEALSDAERQQLLAFLNTLGYGPRPECPPPGGGKR